MGIFLFFVIKCLFVDNDLEMNVFFGGIGCFCFM